MVLKMEKAFGKLLIFMAFTCYFMTLFVVSVSSDSRRETVSNGLHRNTGRNEAISDIISPPTTMMSLVLPVGRTAERTNFIGGKSDSRLLTYFKEKQRIPEKQTTENRKKYERKLKRIRHNFCHSFVPRQRKICKDVPELVAAAVDGTTIAADECKRQFKYERWNCSLLMTKLGRGRHLLRLKNNLFGEILTPALRNATREAAFVNAIMSAGIAYSITASCRRGELTGCHCDTGVAKLNLAMNMIGGFMSWGEAESSSDNELFERATLEAIRNRKLYGETASSSTLANRTWMISRNFKGQIALVEDLKKISWGGCSDDVRFGMRFSRKFLEAPYKGVPRKRRTMKDDIKLHNGEVGRRMVQDLTKVHCRCHGMSGACTSQTCWMQMPSFEEIGNALKKRYMDGTVKVQMKKRRRRLRHVTDSTRLRKVPKTQLTYLNDTPNMCHENKSIGVFGTADRQCLKNSEDRGDCRRLCCGRGYTVKQVKRKWSCKCKFYYCCKVECETCVETRHFYTCR